MTPPQGGPQRLLPREHPVPAREQTQSTVKPLGDLLRAQRFRLGGRQFEGQGKPAKTPADGGHGIRVARIHSEAGPTGTGALHEQGH